MTGNQFGKVLKEKRVILKWIQRNYSGLRRMEGGFYEVVYEWWRRGVLNANTLVEIDSKGDVDEIPGVGDMTCKLL